MFNNNNNGHSSLRRPGKCPLPHRQPIDDLVIKNLVDLVIKISPLFIKNLVDLVIKISPLFKNLVDLVIKISLLFPDIIVPLFP